MNSLIKKFWNDAGYALVLSSPDFDRARDDKDFECRYLWILSKNNFYTGLAGVSEIFYGSPRPDLIKCHFYVFNNKQYLEADMLKIIELKAFF